jgi:acyl carrier protein
MVPPTMILLDALPRLPNLKIDYQNLTNMDAARMAPATGTIDDPLVHEVAKIFEAVLGAVEATPEDNILSLGGDSLQAMKVAIALERHFDMTIPAGIYHGMQSIRDLAGWISQAVRRRPSRSRRRR